MAIVAPRNNEQDQDDIHELMEDVIGALFRGHQASLIERTELWAYNQDTGIWKELKTRGLHSRQLCRDSPWKQMRHVRKGFVDTFRRQPAWKYQYIEC